MLLWWLLPVCSWVGLLTCQDYDLSASTGKLFMMFQQARGGLVPPGQALQNTCHCHPGHTTGTRRPLLLLLQLLLTCVCHSFTAAAAAAAL